MVWDKLVYFMGYLEVILWLEIIMKIEVYKVKIWSLMSYTPKYMCASFRAFVYGCECDYAWGRNTISEAEYMSLLCENFQE